MESAVSCARCILFQLRRAFVVLKQDIYLAQVRPILEYGRQASSPYLHRDIALMERIQRLATRMVKGMRELPLEDRFRRLNLFSLERRCLHGNLILAYNIFHGRLGFPQAEFFEAPTEEYTTSRYVIVVSAYSEGKQRTP